MMVYKLTGLKQASIILIETFVVKLKRATLMNIKIIKSELHSSASENVKAENDLQMPDKSLAETLDKYDQEHKNAQENETTEDIRTGTN